MEQDFGLFESLDEAKALEVVTEQGFKEQVLFELMEAADNTIGKNGSKCIYFGMSVAEALAKQAELKQIIDKVIKHILPEISALAEEYGEMMMLHEGKMQKFILNVEHIFIPEIFACWKYNPKRLKQFDLSGWHYGLLEQLEKEGLFKVVRCLSKKGCRYVECLWDYSEKPIKKTLFPDHWSKKDVIEKIKEAFLNIEPIEGEIELINEFNKKVVGVTSEGIKIEIMLKRNSLQDNWNIVTAYVKEEFITGCKKYA